LHKLAHGVGVADGVEVTCGLLEDRVEVVVEVQRADVVGQLGDERVADRGEVEDLEAVRVVVVVAVTGEASHHLEDGRLVELG